MMVKSIHMVRDAQTKIISKSDKDRESDFLKLSVLFPENGEHTLSSKMKSF